MKMILVQIFEVPDVDPRKKIEEGTFPGKIIATGQWSVEQADTNGRVRSDIGVFLSKHVGQHIYRTSTWIKAPRDVSST